MDPHPIGSPPRWTPTPFRPRGGRPPSSFVTPDGKDSGHWPDEEHLVYASDLVAVLGVSEQEAEEMIFIADLQESTNCT